MAVIEIHGVHYAYPDPRPVLTGVSLELGGGETLGLVGRNGCGKTTLFLLLAGILRPQQGEMQVLGRAPTDPELRGRVAVVFQNADDQLFSTTVHDDVAFGPLNLGLSTDETERRVREALEAVGLAGFEERVPHHLSGGEKRMVALAANIAMSPEVFLLDEPSSDLDPTSRRDLIGLLGRLETPKIIATHDFELLVEVADRVAVLADGCIPVCGPPLEVLADEECMVAHGLEVPAGVRALRELRARDGDGEGSTVSG